MAENLDLKLTAEAWAKIVIERWERKILRLKIGQYGNNSTHELAKSFTHHVITNADGNPEQIEFTFNYYGKFVDMGVGNGVKYGEPGRKAKAWYSKTFFSQIEQFKIIWSEKYGLKAQMTIIDTIQNTTI